jgi:hypothetical protein
MGEMLGADDVEGLAGLDHVLAGGVIAERDGIGTAVDERERLALEAPRIDLFGLVLHSLFSFAGLMDVPPGLLIAGAWAPTRN